VHVLSDLFTLLQTRLIQLFFACEMADFNCFTDVTKIFSGSSYNTVHFVEYSSVSLFNQIHQLCFIISEPLRAVTTFPWKNRSSSMIYSGSKGVILLDK